MMNRLQIRLGGPYFTAFLVNRITIDLQNRQMGLAGMGGFIALPRQKVPDQRSEAGCW
jgi:hypothetical protein